MRGGAANHRAQTDNGAIFAALRHLLRDEGQTRTRPERVRRRSFLHAAVTPETPQRAFEQALGDQFIETSNDNADFTVGGRH